MNELKINNSVILIKSQPPWTNEYYQYIISLLKLIINKNNLSINIILGDQDYNFHNENKTIKMGINYEHTLVKKNGRGILPHTQVGKIIYDQTQHYLVRIEKFNQLNSCDIVIDYSIPNIFNVKESELFDDFSKKHIYIAPSLYKKNIENRERTIHSLSTFIDVNEPRRKALLEKISESNLNHINRNNCFDAHVLEEVYQNTKILINIHQTPHHDTFEELRCLPALQNGVIVVAEKSPLNHLIPYNDLIIWSDYDNIIEKTAEVLENYDDYFKKIFTNENMELLYKMDDKNKNNLEDKIINCTYEDKKIIVYIHVACLNNYEEIFNNLIKFIKESDLYDAVDEIRCGVLGIQSEKFKNIINEHTKLKIVLEGEDLKLYESFTLNKMIEDSKIENSYILYLHTKGCTKPNNNNVKSWVDYLCYFNITKWKLCLKYLSDNDMVGVNLQGPPTHPLHYAGNFWWSKSDYVKCKEKIIQISYYDPEFHFANDESGKFISLWHSHCQHYYTTYPKKCYENKEIKPYHEKGKPFTWIRK